MARLARKFGQTTAEARAAWTRDGAGTILKHTETGACIFLGVGSCTVYHDRPLVCRVFPLGRELLVDGSEHLFLSKGERRPGGEFTRDGTIGNFLEIHGVAPFAKAADEYFYWFCTVADRLDISADDPQLALADAAMLAAHLVDMDAVIAFTCTTTGKLEPTGIEERKQQHLEFLYQKLDEYEAMTRADGYDQPEQVERSAAQYWSLLAAASLLAASLGVVPVGLTDATASLGQDKLGLDGTEVGR
jgi:Fe-S-cluster containining protein